MQTKTILAILGTGVLLCGAGGLGFSRVAERVLDFRPAAAELPKAEREYRAAGLPWTVKDLVPGPTDPAAREAAALIREAGETIQKESWSRTSRGLSDLIGTDDLEPAEAQLKAYAPTLARLERAAAIGRVDFARDLDLGPYLRLPEYANLKAGVRTLGDRARVRAARGDLAGARSDLRAMRSLARMTESDGILIALLVRIACDAITDDAVQRATARDPRLVAGVLADLERPAPAPDFVRTLRYEAYFSLATARNVKGRLTLDDLKNAGAGLRMETDPTHLLREGTPPGLIERAYTARSLQVWTRIADPMRRYAKDPTRLGKEADRIAMAEGGERGMSHILNRIALPVFAMSGMAVGKDEASRAVTLAYLRALDARRRTGRFPKVLITGSDPFGRPYVGRPEGKGFRIYSCGANGKDDGGLTAVERAAASKKGDDVTALFPPAERPPLNQMSGSRMR